MALRLRGRRALSFLNQFLHHQQKSATVSHLLPRVSASTTLSSTNSLNMRPFTSTTNLFMSYDSDFEEFGSPDNNYPESEEMGPPVKNNIFLPGCDYKHWLITVNFPKDVKLSREQMIQTYIDTAAQIFGSVEEAKKRIYALSTTTYQGFQVECTEEISEKFKDIPGVVFVLPDTYIDILNKQYGGDKYVNGEIFPRDLPNVPDVRRNSAGEEYVIGEMYPRDMSIPDGRRTSGDGCPIEQMPYQQKAQQNFVDECLNW